MLIEDMDCIFEIPDEMIKKYVIEFAGYKKDYDRDAICSMRDTTFLLIEALRADPKALDDVTIVNSFIKAHAMRLAMEKLGMLYDA